MLARAAAPGLHGKIAAAGPGAEIPNRKAGAIVIDSSSKAAVAAPDAAFDHSSDPRFLDYYADASLSPAALERFRVVRDKLLKMAAAAGRSGPMEVADIGCGAGTQCRLWAELGHRVHGVDVNEPLIQLARQRAREAGLEIRFECGDLRNLLDAGHAPGRPVVDDDPAPLVIGEAVALAGDVGEVEGECAARERREQHRDVWRYAAD